MNLLALNRMILQVFRKENRSPIKTLICKRVMTSHYVVQLICPRRMGINDPSQGMWQIDLAVLPLYLGSADRQTYEKTRKKEASLFPFRQISWSGTKEKSNDELLIESTVLEWHEQKHRRRPSGSKDTHAGCGRRFTPLTNTIFDSEILLTKRYSLHDGYMFHLRRHP